MNTENDMIKKLCLDLMHADSEDDVVDILKDSGYWDNPACWRNYGDYENNYNTIGNQQSSPDAALVEKLVNAVDARLMNECLARAIDPEGEEAPQDIRSAVARFFEEGYPSNRTLSGLVSEWADAKRTEVARGITLAATGSRGAPSFSIADCGEGQTPNMMPDTFLSTTGSNKLRVPFVQGKFNMGGTGVLTFCGNKGLQLILTRRNPALVSESVEPSDNSWGFTIVRREDPIGNRRSSVYKYLAPIGISENPERGQVLRFNSNSMPLFPDGQKPYGRTAEYGTLIKLYEYQTRSRTHMLLSGGIQSPLDILLTDLALPIRLHECRDFSGSKGSFETTLTGLGVRLGDDKTQNLEDGFPDSAQMSLDGQEMRLNIYAFKKSKARAYRSKEGVLFTVNGQTHGHLTDDFFRRKKVGLDYLRRDLLVVIDCSDLSGRSREDLFKNSRDRLSDHPLRWQIESELEDLLKNHPGLRSLRERRRREEIASRLDDAKPLEDILTDLLRHSPTLSSLFLEGKRVASPFKSRLVNTTDEEFSGRTYPTYFKFKGKDYGIELDRNTHVNQRARVDFETDASNDYFKRAQDPGRFRLLQGSEGMEPSSEPNYSINLHNGIATLNVTLPENCRPGDDLEYTVVVEDSTQTESFKNKFRVHVQEAQTPHSSSGTRRKPPGDKTGVNRELPSGIALPNIFDVREEDWSKQDPAFSERTAMRIKHAGDEDSNGNAQDIYDFYVNIDNQHLRNELKSGRRNKEIELTTAQFRYGLVLIGLALLQGDAAKTKNGNSPSKEEIQDESASIDDVIENVAESIAPVLLPMIDSLGSLDLGDD